MNQNFERIQFITAEVDSLSHFDVARKACETGVKWIQYRNKNASLIKMSEEALRLKILCKEFKTKL